MHARILKSACFLAALALLQCASPKGSYLKDLGSAPSAEEIREHLGAQHIYLAPDVDAQVFWRELNVQARQASAHAEAMAVCEGVNMRRGRDACTRHKECTTRIEPSCDMCQGGPVVCVPRETPQQDAYYKERTLKECIQTEGATWRILAVEGAAQPTYQHCSCGEDARAIEAFVRDGQIFESKELGACASERAHCEAKGGTFMGPQLLSVMSKQEHEARGIALRPGVDAAVGCDGLSYSPDGSGEVFHPRKDLSTGECVVYRFAGRAYDMTRGYEEKRERIAYRMTDCKMR